MLSDMLRTLQKSPTYKTLRNIKSEEENTRLLRLYSDYDTMKKESGSSLDDFIAAYLGDNAAQSDRTAQDIGSMDQFFNGDLSRTLSDLRVRTAQARGHATDLAVAGSARRLNASRILADGGSSSYDSQLDKKTRAEIMVPGALADLDQERRDLGFITQGQLGLAGRRQALADSNTGRLLVPGNLTRQEYMQNLAGLSALGGEQRNNTFYGLQQNKTGFERFNDFLGASEQTANEVMSMIGSIYGGGAGGMLGGMGGSQTKKAPAQTPNPFQYSLDSAQPVGGGGASSGIDYNPPSDFGASYNSWS